MQSSSANTSMLKNRMFIDIICFFLFFFWQYGFFTFLKVSNFSSPSSNSCCFYNLSRPVALPKWRRGMGAHGLCLFLGSFPCPAAVLASLGIGSKDETHAFQTSEKILRGEHRNRRYRAWGATASLIRQNLSPFASIQAVPYPGYQTLIFYITNPCKNKVGKNEGFLASRCASSANFQFCQQNKMAQPRCRQMGHRRSPRLS